MFVLGLFYAAGGIVLVRRMAVDTMLDKAIAAITLKTDKAEDTATRILTVGAWLTLASGLALMAQSRAAVVLFALNIALQGAYLVWASRARVPEDEADRQGRQATINAYFIYIGAFGLVILMEQRGLWRPWFGTGLGGLAAELMVAGLTTAAFVWMVWNPPGARSRKGGRGRTYPDFLSDDDDDQPAYDPSIPPVRLRLAPEYQCWPTWDDASFYNVDPAGLGFSDALLKRLEDWDALFQKSYNPDDPFNSGFASVADERLWADQAIAVWEGICEEWTGEAVNKISHVPYLMETAFEGVNAYALPGEEALQRMANNCGVFEIRDVLFRLDELAAQRAAVPDWDGDTQDDIARVQEFYARALARVAGKYREDVAAGLASPEEETRRWVGLALDRQLS
ncbi:hypothetical protein HHI_13755 [Hyphomonas hirschiana VP5]|uniref:Uncharacterized protein n=2 Tax=Hyphomonas TaxID=85 RepID=A0A059FJG7_9PROT|nr:hypothetical protein HHI_13755 [Hyphomonas hirschiana VP5]